SVFRVDIGATDGKKDFLARLAHVLNFPEHFGHNWDALNDCLTDLDTGKGGYVLILENAGSSALQRHDWDIARRVLGEVAEYWRNEGRPFWAFIQGTPDSTLPWAQWPA